MVNVAGVMQQTNSLGSYTVWVLRMQNSSKEVLNISDKPPIDEKRSTKLLLRRKHLRIQVAQLNLLPLRKKKLRSIIENDFYKSPHYIEFKRWILMNNVTCTSKVQISTADQLDVFVRHNSIKYAQQGRVKLMLQSPLNECLAKSDKWLLLFVSKHHEMV